MTTSSPQWQIAAPTEPIKRHGPWRNGRLRPQRWGLHAAHRRGSPWRLGCIVPLGASMFLPRFLLGAHRRRRKPHLTLLLRRAMLFLVEFGFTCEAFNFARDHGDDGENRVCEEQESARFSTKTDASLVRGRSIQHDSAHGQSRLCLLAVFNVALVMGDIAALDNIPWGGEAGKARVTVIRRSLCPHAVAPQCGQ